MRRSRLRFGCRKADTRLFKDRQGVLRVVISTETLALGINAPARTAVFGGDSVALNVSLAVLSPGL